MKQISEVEAYWNSNPCHASIYFGNPDKKAAFTQIEKERYSVFTRILKFARFDSFQGKRVLEIGCGIGTDGIQFARNGAIYTGVDLTDAAINIARERFALFDEQGEFIKINAEKLPFLENYFDYVYSFGVIHHSPQPELIVDEIYRVLKPGGSITIMLYNRTSFYYLIEVKIIRKIFFNFCQNERFCKAIFSIFNKKYACSFERFRNKLVSMKKNNPKPNNDEWVSMNTDDVFCPIARVYSKSDARKLFRKLRDFSSAVWFIDQENWFLWILFCRFLPKAIKKHLELKFGWFRMVQAKK